MQVQFCALVQEVATLQVVVDSFTGDGSLRNEQFCSAGVILMRTWPAIA